MKQLCGALAAILLVTGCSSLSTGEKAVGTGKDFKGPIGLQLYSLRAKFSKDVPGTLDLVKSNGIKYVELAGTYNLTPDQFKKLLADRGLEPISGHFSYDLFRDKPEEVAKQAKALGLKYAGCAWISHKAPFDEAQAKGAIEVFNKAGAALKKEGIQFFYHNHGYEFRPAVNETYMDLLIKGPDPKLVAFEMDTFWVKHPGADPTEWLNKYPNRWKLMHVKDMKHGTESNFSGGSNVNNDVALGTGVMNWPSILAAAKKAGVEYYFIEDESDAAAEHLPISLKYLEEVKF
ncbi:MAG TPA: sugar phosphate isomerase/epimerase [Candidatus Kapabacteria bacterium]|nr:sugar phosphate isomerase/epimerase [Candidatus Kapabacteria bacterium]